MVIGQTLLRGQKPFGMLLDPTDEVGLVFPLLLLRPTLVWRSDSKRRDPDTLPCGRGFMPAVRKFTNPCQGNKKARLDVSL